MTFPTPLEVDREIYCTNAKSKQIDPMFPAPREVDREIY